MRRLNVRTDTTIEGPYGASSPLVKGTEPDWQPLPL